ncbi:hypothetical protein BDZ97DRAFT_1934681 [Flammula alnicola]|nr:hypothetical protein BDZ97DRAFT_1934681 [Flammula alnicola]
MLLLLFLLYLSRGSTLATPIATALFTRQSLASDPSASSACTCPDQPNQRSIWDVLWSCFTTIFACSWVAVHPNIPGPGTTWWRLALKRLELMMWTIIAPEMMILWAMRQWFGARTLEDRYRSKGWTKTHGYFLQMGGFMLFKGKVAVRVLSPDVFGQLLDYGSIKFPTITEEEIQDRSKGDALSKILVVGQTTWFIAQCITRAAQGLETTELELVTLAFAVLNGFMYYFWWNKPLDVRTYVPVYLVNPRGQTHEIDPITAIEEPKVPVEFDDERGAGADITNSESNQETKVLTHEEPQSSASQILSYIWPIKSTPIGQKFNGMMGTINESDPTVIAKANQREIEEFYASPMSDERFWATISGVAIMGTIFGAIHCAGWNFSFPSHAEVLLWRASSLVIAGVPLAMALIFLVQKLAFPQELFVKRGWNIVLLFLMDFVLNIGGTLYIVARFALMAEAFAALRDLPPAAKAVVRWSSFLPHI